MPASARPKNRVDQILDEVTRRLPTAGDYDELAAAMSIDQAIEEAEMLGLDAESPAETRDPGLERPRAKPPELS